MTTSEHSQQIDWLAMESESTSSAEDSRAPMSASQARVLDWRDLAAAYGSNTSDSFARYDPATQLLKTSQACLVEGWQTFSEAFPRSGTMRNGTLYRRQPLAPLIDANESGLLPTPAATYYGSNQGGSAGRSGPVRLGLETMARKGLWPTPKSGRDGADFAKLDRSSTGISLQTAVAMWPTPTSTLGSNGGLVTPQKAREGGTLIEALSARTTWPTPTVGDSRSSGSRNTPSSKAHPGVSLTDAVRGDAGTGRMEFATPKASDSKGGAPQDSKGKRDLRLDAKTWPTPTTHDHKGFENTRQSRSGETNGDNLPTVVGGSLNPTWVEWLMGFPAEWTALKPSATPSSRKSRKSSRAPS
jgi:hypothetical protein